MPSVVGILRCSSDQFTCSEAFIAVFLTHFKKPTKQPDLLQTWCNCLLLQQATRTLLAYVVKNSLFGQIADLMLLYLVYTE